VSRNSTLRSCGAAGSRLAPVRTRQSRSLSEVCVVGITGLACVDATARALRVTLGSDTIQRSEIAYDPVEVADRFTEATYARLAANATRQ
jgi:hypothetical protein